MAKTLKQILSDREQVHSYRIKFAFEPHAELLRSLEQFLKKYDLIKMEPAKKTIFQSNPRDFEHLKSGEIWMIDVELGRGMSSGIASQELSKCIFTSEDLFRIRGKNEPSELEQQKEEDDIDLDYIIKLEDPEYKSDALEFEPEEIAGNTKVELAVKDAKDNKENVKYVEYMFAAAGADDKQVWTPPKRDKK